MEWLLELLLIAGDKRIIKLLSEQCCIQICKEKKTENTHMTILKRSVLSMLYLESLI